MSAGQSLTPPKQRRVLIELKRVFDSQGSDYIDIGKLAERTNLTPLDLAHTLQLLRGKKLVDWQWHPDEVEPWFAGSGGAITPAGYDLGYSMAWRTRATRYAIAIGSTLVSSGITAGVSYAASPQAFATLLGGVLSGTLGGTLLLGFALRRQLW